MVLEHPELARENQNWKIYRAHILDSAAVEGVVSHLSGAAPKPVNSRELEAWNSSNAVAKYIILEVITDSLLARLMHHELAHTLYSHLAAIFGDNEPIAIDLPAERSDKDEPLREDSHLKSDGADSACTATIVEGKDVEAAGTATRIAHDTDRDEDPSSHPSELKTTQIHDEKPSSITPAGIPIIPSTPSTNTTSIYPKDPGHPPNAPDGTSRGDDQETAESGGQWQRTTHEGNRNDGKALPAPNLADRTSEMTTGDGPIRSSQTRPINAVKHQQKSKRYVPQPNGRTNAIVQCSNRHPKPKIHLPRWYRLPLNGERYGVTANGYTPSSSGQSMPQKRITTSNESDKLVTISIESENPDSGEIPQVRLGSVRRHADDANGPRDRVDALEGWTDESRTRADAPNTLNGAEMAIMGYGDGAGTYLDAGDAKRNVNETDGIGSHADASTGHEDAHSVETDTLKPANAMEIVSTHQIESKPPDPLTMGAGGRANETDRSSHHPGTLNMHTHAITPADEVGNISTHPTEAKLPNSPPGSARERAEHPNGLGNRADMTSGPTDVQSIAHETETAANASKTVSTRPNIPKPPNSPSGDAKRDVDETDGLGGHVDASNGQADPPSIDMDAIRPANESKCVRTPPNGLKGPDLPVEAASQRSDEPNGCRDHTDASSAQMDAPSIQTGASTPANGTERVRMRRHGSKTQDSPHGREIATPKCTYQWKQVSVADGDVYLPQNTPIDRTGRIFVFGRVEGRVEAIAPSVEGERAGNGTGNRDERSGDMNGTTSSGSVDST